MIDLGGSEAGRTMMLGMVERYDLGSQDDLNRHGNDTGNRVERNHQRRYVDRITYSTCRSSYQKARDNNRRCLLILCMQGSKAMAVHDLVPSTSSPSVLDRAPTTREITVAEDMESPPPRIHHKPALSREKAIPAQMHSPRCFPAVVQHPTILHPSTIIGFVT